MGFFSALPGLTVTFEQILQHIQAQYPGQLVLYAADLAKVLGKTEKALAHLISRDQLPFELKSLGGRKCVDIFQLAAWLTRVEEEAQASAPAPRGRRRAGAAQAAAVTPTKERGSKGRIGARLMEMRHEAARNMHRLGTGCADIDDTGFFNELAEGLLAQAGVSGGRWTVAYTGWKPAGVVLVREAVKVFAHQYEDILPAIASFEAGTAGAARATLVARRGRSAIYRAFFIEGVGWTVVFDALEG